MSNHCTSRPIRVLEVMEATIGGTKRHLLALASGLDRGTFRVEIAAPVVRSEAFDDLSFTDDVKKLGLRHHHVPMQRAISAKSDAASLFRLVRIIRHGRFDVVHTHSSKAGFLGRFAARIAGFGRTVHTPHGFYFLNQPGGAKRAFYTNLERLAGVLTDRLITLSPTEMREATENRIVPAARTVLIENGIEVPELPDPVALAPLRESLAPGASQIVGTVARITPQKGPFDFVQMAAELVRLNPGTHLLWCGDGELRAEVESASREAGVASNLHFLGYRTDVMQVMAVMDIFVLTSHWEGLPYTVLDAMALGKPVVATAAVGTRDIVEDGVTGMLTPVGDAASAARAVAQLLGDDTLAKKMGVAGRETVLRKYSQEAMVKRTGQLYLDLVG